MIPTGRRKNNKNKKIIIGVLIGLAVITCIVVAMLLLGKSDASSGSSIDEPSSESQSIPKHESSNGNTDDTGLSSSDENMEDVAKKKEYYIDFVDLAVLQNGGGNFDIHIRFPNGEDYVVVARVAITDITEDGFFVSLDDRQNHMLSSARTDRDVYAGTMLYLARCKETQSEVSNADYPWNQYVLGAHGVDEGNREDIYAKRIQLEENLVKFMNQTLNR